MPAMVRSYEVPAPIQEKDIVKVENQITPEITNALNSEETETSQEKTEQTTTPSSDWTKTVDNSARRFVARNEHHRQTMRRSHRWGGR